MSYPQSNLANISLNAEIFIRHLYLRPAAIRYEVRGEARQMPQCKGNDKDRVEDVGLGWGGLAKVGDVTVCIPSQLNLQTRIKNTDSQNLNGNHTQQSIVAARGDVSRLRKGAGAGLRLNLLFGKTSYQKFDAVLAIAVLGGVDERIDTAVGEHQHHGEVVEPKGQELQHRRRRTKYQSRSSSLSMTEG